MKRTLVLIALVSGVSGCAAVSERFGLGGGSGTTDQTTPADPFVSAPETVETSALDPATAAPPPPASARSAESLDTTTPEQRAAAAAPAAEGSRALGTTVASLGDPTQPGLWLKTPLVGTESQGRVTNPATGKSSAVTLIPRGGEATGGSQMSLAALRLIGASLTDLTEVEVALEG
ncbi:hypothetical protein BOO69_06485 [Sulfitobacter alexandrii]|uniref:D-galactarate dehydratase n=1 Tax=Sulfitobacter alexandrii TaxID=1917485 RepID=A0A1J0WFK6_9RHOB|nr:hypothetical protein [Sulfitobacter alexandrii]APE43099.1 hypothetical protein BOO69_06485 [Sulfitobacter alexandrii]